MAKTITVINTKGKWESFDCSKAEAARIIGVAAKTIINWSKRRDHEIYNHFIVIFNHITIKQPKKGTKKIVKCYVSTLER